jgi:uncharacterized membrane protein
MRVLPIAIAGLLAGCAAFQRPQPPLPPIADRIATAYVCDNGDVIVTERDGSRVFLYLPAQTVVLQPVSGGWVGEDVRLTRTDAGVRLRYADEPPSSCVADAVETRRQDARLRGVDFRAQGREPVGWQLEIGPRAAVFATVEGLRARFPMTDSEVDPATGATAYRFSDEGHQLRVQIVNEPCTDPSTAEVFDASVRAVFDGQTYQGCGEALH